VDLNNHLFEQIERLNDDNLKGEDLTTEIHRAGSMCAVASQIISNSRLVLDAVRLADELPGVKKTSILLE
jgi:hypothetical protein